MLAALALLGEIACSCAAPHVRGSPGDVQQGDVKTATASEHDQAGGGPITEKRLKSEKLTLDAGAYLRGRITPHFEGPKGGSRGTRTEGTLRLELDAKKGKTFRLYAEPELQLDNDHLARGVLNRVEESRDHRHTLSLREVYIERRAGETDFKIGKQIFSWGTADLYNPTDYINPWDLSDILDNEKIGVVSFFGSSFLDPVQIDLVLTPTFTPSRLPREDGRWGLIPDSSELLIRDPTIPARTFENVQAAVRAKTSLKGWDLSLSYYDGIRNAPRATLRRQWVAAAPFPGAPVARIEAPYVSQAYDRIRAVGGDFSTTLAVWEIHGEAAHFWTDGRKEDSYLQYVIGATRRWDDVISTHDITATFEYAGEAETAKTREANVGEALERLYRPFKNALLSRVTYELTPFKALEIEVALNFDEPFNTYLGPRFKWRPKDNITLTWGLDVLTGVRDTTFGRFSHNDRVYFMVELWF